MKIQTSTLTLIESYMLTPHVKHFRFQCPYEKINTFIPGQFITMHFEEGGQSYKRSYSIANTTQSTTIEFAAGYVPEGPASEILFNLKPGDEIQANGPFGRLTLKDEPVGRYILIATSTGVTPYRSMLNQLSEKLHDFPELEVHILLGVRKREDLIYKDDFLGLMNQQSNAYFHACYSREDTSPLEGFEFLGHVQDKLKLLMPDHEKDIVYLCGNPAMVDTCHEMLTQHAFTIKQIRREKYLSK